MICMLFPHTILIVLQLELNVDTPGGTSVPLRSSFTSIKPPTAFTLQCAFSPFLTIRSDFVAPWPPVADVRSAPSARADAF